MRREDVWAVEQHRKVHGGDLHQAAHLFAMADDPVGGIDGPGNECLQAILVNAHRGLAEKKGDHPEYCR